MPKPSQKSVAERAVQKFHKDDTSLKSFLHDGAVRDILLEYEALVNARNQSLEEAMRSIKNELRTLDQEKLILDGLGAQKKYKRWYDVDFLAHALPADQAELILTERVVYDLDQDRLEQLARQGEIDNNIVRNAFREEEQAPAALPGSPKPYSIPAIPVDDD